MTTNAELVTNLPGKRKLRKGTQSCWECKRRKTRCIFAAPMDPFCVGCKSRGLICVGQEFDEELSAIRRKVTKPKRTVSAAAGSPRRRQEKEQKTALNSAKPGSLLDSTSTGSIDPSATYHKLYCALAEVWPCDRDLESIHSITNEDFSILDGPLYGGHSDLAGQNNVSPRDVLQLPPYGVHPVVVARKVLLLSAFIQRFPLVNSNGAPTFGDLADRLLHTATTLVTTNDELLESVEGVECVALESMIHNYRGNLTRALLALRKAMVIAQLLGLHRQTYSTSTKVIEIQTRARLDCDYIWFRLVESDRYLSLMLGVPQAWSDNGFLDKKELRHCSPMEQLERLLLVIGGRIIERNETDVQDIIVTQQIDQLLQCASSCMPPQWWIAPDTSLRNIHTTIWTSKLMMQLTYYFLVTQLHFPYLLYCSDSHLYTYSKITAVNASREILIRFLAFRSDPTVTLYCRGIDFIAFFASAALCLAHISGGCGLQASAGDGDGTKAFYYLTHQRIGDRGLVEKTLERMERTIRSNDDPVVNLLRPLMMMEAASRTGTLVNAVFTAEGRSGNHESSGHVSDCGNAVHIFIPHCGSVHVVRTTLDVESSPTFDSQFDLNMEWTDPSWVSEATLANSVLGSGCAGTQTSECSDPVEEANHSATHG